MFSSAAAILFEFISASLHLEILLYNVPTVAAQV